MMVTNSSVTSLLCGWGTESVEWKEDFLYEIECCGYCCCEMIMNSLLVDILVLFIPLLTLTIGFIAHISLLASDLSLHHRSSEAVYAVVQNP